MSPCLRALRRTAALPAGVLGTGGVEGVGAVGVNLFLGSHSGRSLGELAREGRALMVERWGGVAEGGFVEVVDS